jgi:hypothetical protein
MRDKNLKIFVKIYDSTQVISIPTIFTLLRLD